MTKLASTKDSLNRLLGIAALCYGHCDEAIGIIAFLEAGNTKEAEAAFQNENGHIPNLIRKAMFERLHLSMMRMHDKPGTDRESLPRAFEILENADVYNAVCNRGDKSRLDAAIAEWLIRDPRVILNKLRSVRDYEVAHNIPTKAGNNRPLINDLLETAQSTFTLVESLAAGTGVCFVTFYGSKGIWDKRAAAYWQRLIDAPSNHIKE